MKRELRNSHVSLASRRGHGGFTLVELMIALALSVFLIGAMVLTYISGRAAAQDAEVLSRTQENVRLVTEYLVRDLRNAGFRDETILLLSHERAIRSRYAEVLDDGSTIRVRYAGQGHCAEVFDEIRLIENEYSFASDESGSGGRLLCRGRSIDDTISGDDLGTETPIFSPPVTLATGVTGLRFDMICPNGVANCDCDFGKAEDSCLGVTVGLTLQGLRALDGEGFTEVSFELVAAFRNMILERIILGLDS